MKNYRWDLTLVILILLEIAFLLYFKTVFVPVELNGIFFTGTGILFAIVFFIKYYGWTNPESIEIQSGSKFLRILPVLFLGAVSLSFIPELQSLFEREPVNKYSDIIPTIQIAVRRFLNGGFVYSQLQIGKSSQPLTYLPMQWLPFTPAEIFDFDYRWIAVAVFVLSGFFLIRSSSVRSWQRGLLVAALLLFFIRMLLQYEWSVIAVTVELMVAGFYMLLILALSGRNPWLKGLMIGICLLSRFSLLLWLPLWFFVEWLSAGRIQAAKSAAVIVLMVTGMYVLPFMTRDWGIFTRAYHYYSFAAWGEWQSLTDRGIPFQLDQGVGFARYFFQGIARYSPHDRLLSLQKFHFFICTGSTILMALIYLMVRQKVSASVFFLVSFKIYISLFLAFIQVPYVYLMITTVAVSIAMFAAMSNRKILSASAVARPDAGPGRIASV